VNRLTQHLVLVLVGGFALAVGLGDAYLRYVQAGFRPLLLGAAVVMVVVGVAGMLRERRRPAPGHDHPGPRVSWLLVLPVVVLILVPPSALGSYVAARQAQPVVVPDSEQHPGDLGPDDPGTDHRTMSVLEYSLRALAQETTSLDGRQVRLVGFVTPRDDGGWYLSRVMIKCCAADAVPINVVVDGTRGKLTADQWVEVVGVWAPARPHPTAGYPEPVVVPGSVTPVERPADTYEG
jgi:uncharacterized repeat protein (TIGR03943 family)